MLQDLAYTAQAMEVIRVKHQDTAVHEDLGEAAEAIYDLRAYRHRGQSARQLFESLVELNRRRMPDRKLECDLDESLLDGLSGRAAVELLRVVQEALTNVRRHSDARTVSVVFSSSGGVVRLEVSDDGKGFDPKEVPPGIGTVGMRERALNLGGSVEIESSPGAGTRVRFEVPLQNVRE